jgi:hypothetical protein
MFSYLTYFLPKMSSARSMKTRLVAIHDGDLYTSNITGHVDQMHVLFENGLNPFVANPNLMFFKSNCKIRPIVVNMHSCFRIHHVSDKTIHAFVLVCHTNSLDMASE